MKLENYLKTKRMAKGLSQGQVALRLGCTYQYISNIERDLVGVSGRKLTALAPILNLSKEELVDLFKAEVDRMFSGQ